MQRLTCYKMLILKNEHKIFFYIQNKTLSKKFQIKKNIHVFNFFSDCNNIQSLKIYVHNVGQER